LRKRNKKFEKLERARAPVSADKVKSIIEDLFAGRIKVGEGTSHRYKIQVPELKDLPNYQFGLITIPIKSGQEVKAFYLQTLYEAAVLLGLYPPPVAEEDREGEEYKEGEEDNE
jgi:hypothetical protein